MFHICTPWKRRTLVLNGLMTNAFKVKYKNTKTTFLVLTLNTFNISSNLCFNFYLNKHLHATILWVKLANESFLFTLNKIYMETGFYLILVFWFIECKADFFIHARVYRKVGICSCIQDVHGNTQTRQNPFN